MTDATPAPGKPAGDGRVLVVGLGSPDRGDDAVGIAVAEAVAVARLPRVEVLLHEDPTDLIELWSGFDAVVLVDAVCSGDAPGTVRTMETGAEADPLPSSSWSATGRGSTHALGVATAVELARALHRLPRRLTLVGVEAEAFAHGSPLSPEVAAAVPRAAQRVGALAEELSRDTRRRRREQAHVPG